MDKNGVTILVGVGIGFLARLYMLRVDYRQYPSYPHGHVIHLSLGFIASALGAIAIPALLEKEYTAVTFLVLAAQQFREIRNMERETMTRLEEKALVPRGLDYIEGIAKVFEARNYLVILVALVTSLFTYWLGITPGIIAGVFAIVITSKFMRGNFIGDIAEVLPCELYFEKSLLMIDNIVIMNVGLEDAKEKILKDGLAVLIKPYNDNARATLNNLGQRQAILHDASALLGNKLETGELDFSPMIRKDIDTGKLGLFIVPNEPDMECLIEAIKKVPVLESAKQKPLASYIGKKAAD